MQLEKYEQREKHNVTESTVNSRMSALRQFKEFSNPDGEPEVGDVEDWVDTMVQQYEQGEMKASTIKQYFKAVKHYFRRIHGDAEEIDHIRDWIPVGDINHGNYLEREELDDMRDCAYSYRERATLEMLYWYARRPTEIVLLNKADVDLEEDTIKFPILKKDDESFRATYELLSDVKKVLEEYLEYRTPHTVKPEQPWEDEEVEPLFTTNNGRISYSTIWRNIKDIADRANIDKNISPKSMRHSRATHLDWDGTNPQIIARQQLLHNPDTTEVISSYIHPREEDNVREVVTTEDE